MRYEDDGIPPELEPVADALRRGRPEPSPLQLDQLQTRVRARVARSPRRGIGVPLRSRLAITMMLVLGIAFSGTGGALAVNGLSTSGNASVAEYHPHCKKHCHTIKHLDGGGGGSGAEQ